MNAEALLNTPSARELLAAGVPREEVRRTSTTQCACAQESCGLHSCVTTACACAVHQVLANLQAQSTSTLRAQGASAAGSGAQTYSAPEGAQSPASGGMPPVQVTSAIR